MPKEDEKNDILETTEEIADESTTEEECVKDSDDAMAALRAQMKRDSAERLRREEQLEQKMKKYLPEQIFREWKDKKGSSWGRMVSKLPFGSYKKPSSDIEAVCRLFDERIVGRDIEKGEMLRKYASFCLNGRMKRPILLVGEPGCGKSCFAQCFAKATGFPVKYISVPSIAAPMALIGSEQHYSNSRMGDLVKTLISEETLSVVFVFDEIDKAVNNSTEGSVEAALLGLFDPMWNGMFVDRSIDVPVDMSHCVFICTANSIADISEPLLDRMDIIRFDQYTVDEAVDIIEKKTMPDCVGLYDMQDRVSFRPEMARMIVDSVSNASMRDYEKLVEKLVDNAIFNILSTGAESYEITADDLDIILHSEKRRSIGFGF